MIESLIGLVSGIVTGTGMGGGTILIFLLSSFLGIEQHIAQATNLVYFVPTAISAIIVNYKNSYNTRIKNQDSVLHIKYYHLLIVLIS